MIDTPFGRLVESDSVPEGTLLLVPLVTLTRYLNYQTGEVKEYLNFDPKAAGVITNIGKP
jgi:hypothetical protein